MSRTDETYERVAWEIIQLTNLVSEKISYSRDSVAAKKSYP